MENPSVLYVRLGGLEISGENNMFSFRKKEMDASGVDEYTSDEEEFTF